MKTLLKGGTVVSAAASRAADVLIEGEKILAVGENLPADYVCPLCKHGPEDFERV